jgi:N-formylglutamate deformylase
MGHNQTTHACFIRRKSRLPPGEPHVRGLRESVLLAMLAVIVAGSTLKRIAIMNDRYDATVLPGVFERRNPSGSVVPILFEIPRSGAEYPRNFHSEAPLEAMQGSVSAYVETLYERVGEAGATWLYAKFPNTFIDLNCSKEDLDPETIEGVWSGITKPSELTKAGRGLLPATVGDSIPICSGKISTKDLQIRIEDYHRVYHREIADILSGFKKKYGVAYHFSCHSMAEFVSKGADKGMRRSDFDLRDRHGQTASAEILDLVETELRMSGFKVTRNKFFARQECVKRHGRPDIGIHSVQLEMNRGIYMNEKDKTLKEGWRNVQEALSKLAKKIAESN